MEATEFYRITKKHVETAQFIKDNKGRCSVGENCLCDVCPFHPDNTIYLGCGDTYADIEALTSDSDLILLKSAEDFLEISKTVEIEED